MENLRQTKPDFTTEKIEENKEIFKLCLGTLKYEDLVNLLANSGIKAQAIFNVCSPEEIKELISSFADILFDLVKDWDEKKMKNFRWNREAREEVLGKLENKHQEVFEKINNEYFQLTEESKFLSSFDILHRNIKKEISALISTEEEANSLKAEINKKIDEEISKVKNSALDDKHQATVFVKAETIRKDCLEYIDEKLKEEPVKLYYYRTGGRVAVKLKWNKKTYTYRVGRGREVRLNRDDDYHEYSHIVSAAYIQDFLYQNGIRDEDIWVDPRSVDVFYSFLNKVSVNLTPSFVADWWNHDCPDIYRHTPNKHRHTNLLGMPICHFSNKLVETSWSADYIDESITEEEFKALTRGYEHTRIYETIKSVIEARKIKESQEKIETIRKKVHDFDARIQKVIDDNKDEILDYLKEQFKDRVYYLTDGERKNWEYDFKIDDFFGLDCGFLFIQTTDKEYMENRTLLRHLDSGESPWMKISMPYPSQSLTLKKAQFKKVKEIVERETGIELYAHTALD